jgi:hypothetical protein
MSIRFLRYAGIGGFLIGGGTAILLYGGWVPSLPAVGFILAVLAPETARDPAAED